MSDSATSPEPTSNSERTWEVAIVVVFVLVVGAVIGALLFVRRRRKGTDRRRQTLQHNLERRNRPHFYSTEMSVLTPDLSKPTPAVSSKTPIRTPFDVPKTQSPRVSI